MMGQMWLLNLHLDQCPDRACHRVYNNNHVTTTTTNNYYYMHRGCFTNSLALVCGWTVRAQSTKLVARVVIPK